MGRTSIKWNDKEVDNPRTSGRSPRFKFMQKLEANRAEPKKKPKLAYGSIADALKNEKPK